MIFKDKSLEVSIVVQKIQILFKECSKITKRPSHIVIKEPTINQYYAYGFFDGACQGTPGSCWAGAILYLNQHHYFLLKYGVGI